MSYRILRRLTVLFLFAALVLRGAETIEEGMKRAVLDYGQRLRQANEELTQTRERIAREKAPWLKARRAAEDRIIAADALIGTLETGQEQAQENHRRLVKDAEVFRKNENYLGTLAHDSLAAYDEGLLPGERQFLPEQFQALQESLNNPSAPPAPAAAPEVAELLLARLRQSLGGYTMTGSSLVEGSNQTVKGTYAFAGPEAYFRPEVGGPAGTVRMREGTGHPLTYLLPAWKPAEAEAFFQGKMGTVLADASAGKALRLQETKGTLWQHVNKGGVVSYAILGVGLVALLLILQKVRDVARMKVSATAAVERCLGKVAASDGTAAELAVRALTPTTRELFSVGLRHVAEPKDQLEERLTAVLLRQRLHYERWLPLLAVIATAAPLMGLLGTVTGMVRTFALITVFGTGNAGKLASGISEVLVATELGLLVAIPTLVAHGFLSQRIQRNLGVLERYALEFVTAAHAGKAAAREAGDEAAEALEA